MMQIELIADIGCNHMGSMKLAKAMVNALSEGGIRTVKFQAFDDHHLESLRQRIEKGEISHNLIHPTNPLLNNIFFDKVRQAMWTLDQFKEIAEYCELDGVEFLCTPYSVQWVQWLNPLVKRWKIRAADCRNEKLIEACAKTGKPIIMSIDKYDNSWRGKGNYYIRSIYREKYGEKLFHPWHHGGFLYCVPFYPPSIHQMDLWCIKEYDFDGLSDHTPDIIAALLSVPLGAKIIEKHVWYERFDVNCEVNPEECVDRAVSISTAEFAFLRAALNKAESMLKRGL